jgi:imidazole glycerol-phosphate synthase subunit HisH
MKRVVSIIDCGIGNLLSIKNWLSYVGVVGEVVTEPEGVRNAETLILPGVGAFCGGMDGLKKHLLIEPIREFIENGKPFLGICLGMQMLMECSEEFGRCEGLGIIPGRVEPIPETKRDGLLHKIPRIGWDSIHTVVSKNKELNGNLFNSTLDNKNFYFLHSFMVVPSNDDYRIADTYYNGRRICAIIGKDNFFGCQFHPEKSGENGFMLLRNFLAL